MVSSFSGVLNLIKKKQNIFKTLKILKTNSAFLEHACKASKFRTFLFFFGLLETTRRCSSRKAHEYCTRRWGGEKKASICIGRHSSAPLNSVAIATFVQIVPQWPLSSLPQPRSPALPGEKLGANKESSLRPRRRKGPKRRKRSIHE